MTRHFPHARHFILAACLAITPWLAFAGTIEIEKAEGSTVVDLLDTEGRLHVDAMQAMLTSQRSQLLGNGPTSFFKSVRGSMHGATIARVEYSYEKDGVPYIRTYHARSGRSMAVIANLAERKIKAGGSSATESGGTDTAGTDQGLSDVAQDLRDVASDVQRDVNEHLFYPPDTPTDVRVAAVPDGKTDIEAVDIGDGKSHATDAEVKIVRRIDADIEDGIVPRGGRITGYVSKTVCESCRNAFDILGTSRDIDGTVYQLTEPTPNPPGSRQRYATPDETTAKGRSQSASMELKSRRSAYANTTLVKGKRIDPRAQWSDVSVIERAEAASTGELAEACD
jgi:hypothetical protein